MQFFLIFVTLTLAVWLIIWFLLEVKIQDREAAESDRKGAKTDE
jgi:hypothetical protein